MPPGLHYRTKEEIIQEEREKFLKEFKKLPNTPAQTNNLFPTPVMASQDNTKKKPRKHIVDLTDQQTKDSKKDK